uniref:Uncharacterized protein n=1 Tax=Arundo donax TaxID=35708 RepID=A0A0A9DKZ7_ARUDO
MATAAAAAARRTWVCTTSMSSSTTTTTMARTAGTCHRRRWRRSPRTGRRWRWCPPSRQAEAEEEV